jgi:hypothetical protein
MSGGGGGGGGGGRAMHDDEDDDGEDYYNVHRPRGALGIPPSEQQTLPLHASMGHGGVVMGGAGDMLPPYSTSPRYT